MTSSTSATEYTAPELYQLKRKQLQSMCKKHGIKANGKSEELIEQLLECTDKPEEYVSATEDISRRVAEELDARTSSLDTQERQEILNQQTPHKPTAESLLDNPPRTPSFDKVHCKLFDMDQSIASHWSVTSPRSIKRTNSVELAESCKRPRIESLFGSPRAVKNGKVPRTVAVPVGGRTKQMLDREDGVMPAPLFAKQSTEPTVEGKIGVPKEEEIAKETIEQVAEKKSVKSAESAKPTVQQEAVKEPVEQVAVKPVGPTEPIVEESTEASKDIKEDVVKEPTKPIVEQEAEIPKDDAKEPTGQVAANSVESAKPIVEKKDAVSKTAVKNKTSVVSGGKIQKKPLSAKSQSYRSVESKLKSYLNTKPPSPKVKPIKHSRPTVTKQPPKPLAKPKQPVVRQSTDGVPNYMRSTKSKQLKTVAK